MEQSSGIRTWQWVVTVIVIIILIIIGILVFGNDKEGTDTDLTIDTTTTTETSGTPEAMNRVVLGDQFPGNVVFISSVTLDKAGWVEIHADNNGQPGAYIGSQYFDKGINTGKITLTKPTVEGGLYYVMLHSDDGDKVFNPEKDLPIKDSKGNIIMKLFHATAAVGAGLKG